jgi:hypothetical protein
LSVRIARLEALGLGSIACLTIFVFLWGFNGDSPICTHNDESYFALPALNILTSRDPNPHTFINPASTLIYPLAGYYALLEQATSNRYIDHDQPPWLMCAQQIETLIKWPRLANVFLLLATILFLYLAGRDWVGKDAAMLGVLLYSLNPMVVYYSQILRPDTLANFFICLAMLLLGMAAVTPTNRKLAVALGVCSGLAISTRYFCVALIPPLLAVYGISFFETEQNQQRKELALSLLFALICSLFSFFCTSPFVFLDYQQAVKDLSFESQSQFSRVAGLGPLGNFRYYFARVLPRTMGTLLTLMSLLGLVLKLKHSEKKTVIYSILSLFIIGGTCLNSRHWDRWIIPMLPIVCLLTGFALTSSYAMISQFCEHRVSVKSARFLTFIVCTIFCAYAFLIPVRNILCLEIQKGDLSGRAKAFYFVKEHIPEHSKIACDMSWDWPDRDRYIVLENIWRPDFVPPRPHNYYLPEDLAKQGYQFMIVQRENRRDYSLAKQNLYPREARFYSELRKHAPLLYTSYAKPRFNVLGKEVKDMFTAVEVYDLRPLAQGIYPQTNYHLQDGY